jgi:DNA (cytosine-5)-methyltransferase 1
LKEKMNVLDLFSGIGGFSLGLERAGMRTVAFCEIDPFCQRVLAKHWPGVPIFDDIRKLKGSHLIGRVNGQLITTVDVICGGFPCQDLSIAQGASRAGLDGQRSGLWKEYARLIGELRPRFIIVENVPGLLSLGLDRVLGDLAALRYSAEWDCVPAGAVGAPHIRDRFWLVGYPDDEGQSAFAVDDEASRLPRVVTDADRSRLEVVLDGQAWQCAPAVGAHVWSSEPDVDRVAYGVPNRVDRIRALGNTVVPQIPEIIGRAIMTRYAVTSPHGGSL